MAINTQKPVSRITYNGVELELATTEPTYETPSINVSAGGLITASANGKTAEQQLDVQDDLTVNGATVTAPAGYYATQAQKSVATGTAGTPSASKGAVSNHSVTVTPSVTNTTGYITGGTKTGTSVTVTAAELVSGSETKTENGTYDVRNLAELVVNVTGGGGMNVQCYMGSATVTSTSYTATAVKLTVKTSGTYNVSWSGWRNTNSGTSGSQLYIAGTAYGSANTTFSNTYGHVVKLTGVKLTAGQEIVVRARARSTSYVMGVANLCIEQTA